MRLEAGRKVVAIPPEEKLRQHARDSVRSIGMIGGGARSLERTGCFA
jgi:hypothetical protein